MSHSILNEIAGSVKLRLNERRALVPYPELQKSLIDARTPFNFTSRFLEDDICTIAEIKFKSPALGLLKNANAEAAVKIALSYIDGRATALSVLTEQNYFHGDLSYLKAIRQRLPDAYLLMKDFIIDEYQIVEGLINGADAILLIVSLLGGVRTKELYDFAKKMGLSVLVEVHDEAELKVALTMGATLVGINNRNLKTLDVSIQNSFNIMKSINRKAYPRVAFISESGIKTSEEIKALRLVGFNGFLIGSSLMTSENPGAALRKLVEWAIR